MDTIDKAIEPLKPTLKAITQNLPGPISDFAQSLLGPTCHRTLLHNLDFSTSNESCVSLAVSKALGVAIVGASAVVKVPQLLKLVSSQSSEGLSFLSYLLETASFVITLAYNIRHGFPFSTFGETAFIAVQDIIIAVLILVYAGKTPQASIFVAALAAAGYALFGPDGGLVDTPTLGYLQAGAGVLGLASKIPQIYTIWSEGGTGQLSAFAVFNYLFGSLTRIFTTLKEVDDKLILYGFISGFVLNAILAAQLVYYWNSPTTKTQEKKQMRETASAYTTATPKVGTASERKGPSTRRRG